MSIQRIIMSALILFIALPAIAGPPDPDGIRQRLDDYLNRIERIGYSGVVLVGIGENIVYVRGFGWADEKNRIPVRPDTVFTVGSITKQFTATAIMKLVEAGKIHVDDPITRYFEGVPDDKKSITIHHLLTHSAGFPGAIGDDFEPIDREAYIKRALETPLRFPPGRSYAYSNVGYSLLGAILEKVTGKSYEQVLHEMLFRPAGMKDTGYVIPQWEPTRLAHGYENGRDWGTVRDRAWAEDGPYWNLRANGGIHSTALDMFRWHRALQTGKVLGPHTMALMFMPHMPEGPEARTHYGYGWVVARTSWGSLVYTHNGGNGIFFADYYRFPDDDLVIFFATNRAQMGSDRVSRTIVRLVYHQPVELPPMTVEPDETLWQKMMGTHGKEVKVTLTRVGDTPCLSIRADGRDIARILSTLNPADKVVSDKIHIQVSHFIEAFEAGDYVGAFRQLGLEESAESMGSMSTEIMNDLESRIGGFRKMTWLGSYRSKGERVISIVEMVFERSRRYLELTWVDGQLDDIRLRERLVFGPFCHVGDGRFILYRLDNWGGIELVYDSGEGPVFKVGGKEYSLQTQSR